MDDIVAVAVELADGRCRYFLTWGRIFDNVDGSELAAVVLQNAGKYELDGDPLRARICDSLQEAARERYFYESLFEMARKPIPLRGEFEAWRKAAAEELTAGRSLWFLGVPK
jgi:hypothetical protein